MTRRFRGVVLAAGLLAGSTTAQAAGKLPSLSASVGRKPVVATGLDTAQAKANAMTLALRTVLERYGDSTALKSRQKRVEEELYVDAEQYLSWQGQPVIAKGPEGETRYSFNPKVWLASAPEGKRALLSDLRRLGLLPAHRVAVQTIASGLAQSTDADGLGRELEGSFLELGLQPINQAEVRRTLVAAIDRQRLEIHPSPAARQELRIALESNLAETVVLVSLDLAPTRGSQFPTVEGTIRFAVWDGFRGDSVTSGVVAVKPTPGASLEAAAQEVARTAAPSVMQALAGRVLEYTFRDDEEVRLEIDGWDSLEAAREFQKALRGRPGVVLVQEEAILAGMLKLRLTYDRHQVPDGFELLKSPELEKFNVKISGAEGGVLRGKVAEDN